ncbi:transcriptional regulator with XRE-family HTH domain [Streptomyces sp. SAI-195]|jgi:transcriptional regulator with XRE-family HTH domain|uniref:helix-turn-helix domain-containing protein n=1 Tax=Streptomyces sp. SAI-195 TaxID=3377734 RepID=UPI003C7D6008
MTNGSQPEPPITAPFGDWLRWALTHHGYDLDERGIQRKIADDTGIPPATVSRLVRGTSQPDVATCYAIGRTLRVRVMPILVRAGHLPPEALDREPHATERPSPTTEEQALTALGLTNPDDRAAVRAMINALTAKQRREGAN